MVADEMHAQYLHAPIGSIKALGRALRVGPARLRALANRAESLYREVPQTKKDGSIRLTYDARPPLKAVQHRINTRLFSAVRYPAYLHGGIRVPESPRDPHSNARPHSQAYALVLEDIADCFPSIRAMDIRDMWLRLFRFPEEVADCLTSLTTLTGFLPQGAKTSTYIANLAFWDVEPPIVQRLTRMGLQYTRYIDDITVSSSEDLGRDEKTYAISQIYGMLAAKGCRPKRSKHEVRKRGQRLQVTGLVINGKSPAISSPERRRIRAAVYELEVLADSGAHASELREKLGRVRGRVNRLARTGHSSAESLHKRIERVIMQRPDLV